MLLRPPKRPSRRIELPLGAFKAGDRPAATRAGPIHVTVIVPLLARPEARYPPSVKAKPVSGHVPDACRIVTPSGALIAGRSTVRSARNAVLNARRSGRRIAAPSAG